MLSVRRPCVACQPPPPATSLHTIRASLLSLDDSLPTLAVPQSSLAGARCLVVFVQVYLKCHNDQTTFNTINILPHDSATPVSVPDTVSAFAWYDQQALHTAPIALNLVDNAIAAHQLGLSNSAVSINTYVVSLLVFLGYLSRLTLSLGSLCGQSFASASACLCNFPCQLPPTCSNQRSSARAQRQDPYDIVCARIQVQPSIAQGNGR